MTSLPSPIGRALVVAIVVVATSAVVAAAPAPVLAPPAPAASTPPPATGHESAPTVAGPDFDGDGYADLAIGGLASIPGSETVAQSVMVLFGSADGVSADRAMTINQESDGIVGEPGDKYSFASSIGWGDFDADGYDDLVIGDSREPGEHGEAGAVHVIPGSVSGPDTAAAVFISRDRPEFPPLGPNPDTFGAMVTSGDFDGDGYDDLVVGAPVYTADEVRYTGAVAVLFGSADGVSMQGLQWWDRQSLQLPIPASALFGDALASGDANADGYDEQLAIGADQWTEDGHTESGAVVLISGSVDRARDPAVSLWTQATPGVRSDITHQEFFGSSVAFGDLNADGYDDLAVAVPLEEMKDSQFFRPGAAAILYGGPDGITAHGDGHVSQRGEDISGRTEDRDLFGWSTIGDIDGDGADDLVVEVGAESVRNPEGSRRRFAGMLQVVWGDPAGLGTAGDERWTQDSPDVPDDVEYGDIFAGQAAPADYNGDGYADVAVSATQEDFSDVTDAGVVHVLYGTADGLTAVGSAYLQQGVDGVPGSPVANSWFGYPLMGHSAR